MSVLQDDISYIFKLIDEAEKNQESSSETSLDISAEAGREAETSVNKDEGSEVYRTSWDVRKGEAQKDWNEELIRREKIRNDNLESDQGMKRQSLYMLFMLLTIETVAVLVIILLQGFENIFSLEEWSFRIFVSATLLQITAMLHTAIKHLFPARSEKAEVQQVRKAE